MTGSLLEALVGIIKDRSAFKTANLPGSFTALGQNIINEALMSARRYFETDVGFRFRIPDDLCVHGYFQIPCVVMVRALSKVLPRDLQPVGWFNRCCRYAAADAAASS